MSYAYSSGSWSVMVSDDSIVISDPYSSVPVSKGVSVSGVSVSSWLLSSYASVLSATVVSSY